MSAALRDSRHLLIALLVWSLALAGVALIELAPAGGEAPATAAPIVNPLDRAHPGFDDHSRQGLFRIR